MSVCVDFRDRLHDLVEERDLNRTQIAKEMGVDYRSFSNAYNYGILPKPVVLARMADYFRVPLAYLLGRSDNDAFTPAARPESFHERLETLRAEKGVTFYKVAKACHLDKSCISKWYALRQMPSFEILELLADYFQVSPDYLLGRSDDR